jgi:hypothetical protein
VVQERLDAVPDEVARAFLSRCMAEPEHRPGARQLLEDPFLQVGVWVCMCQHVCGCGCCCQHVCGVCELFKRTEK